MKLSEIITIVYLLILSQYKFGILKYFIELQMLTNFFVNESVSNQSQRRLHLLSKPRIDSN